jgi:hypothetical protein
MYLRVNYGYNEVLFAVSLRQVCGALRLQNSVVTQLVEILPIATKHNGLYSSSRHA